MTILSRVRPAISAMSGYTPGEQPGLGARLIKLNTNENPYPPPKVVVDALAAAVGERLRLYPEPTSRPVREAAARAYGLAPEQVLVGNGSDDLLTMIIRTFVDPGCGVASADPTYSLYQTLTNIQGGVYRSVPWLANGGLPVDALVATDASVIFVVRPNSPTGHAVSLASVAELCDKAPGAVVLDEAYADFCSDNGLGLLAEHGNLIITRTFSKSFSLAGLRIGLGFMAPAVAAEMDKVRDSYNVDALAQAAAVAALDHLDQYQEQLDLICAERDHLTSALLERGFGVGESQANFVLATLPDPQKDGTAWLNFLREQGVLVRYFGNHRELADKLRISVGTPEETDALLKAVDLFLAKT